MLIATSMACEAPVDLGADLHCGAAVVCMVEGAARCVLTDGDPAHCGGCGRACAVRPHAVAVCRGGACASVCEAGFGDCNESPDDGCETGLLENSRQCGACGVRCDPASACVNGRCDGRNLALGRPTEQSSTFTGGCPRESGNAVDGRYCGRKTWYGEEPCPDVSCGDASGTLTEPSPWWKVDLGAVRSVARVEVWNSFPFGAFSVGVSSDGERWDEHLGMAPGVPAPRGVRVGASGRWVRIRATQTDALWLREVLVVEGP